LLLPLSFVALASLTALAQNQPGNMSVLYDPKYFLSVFY
jgi:hypothetical protein